MNENDIVIDASYILGTSLLYKNYVDRELLNRIDSRLSKYYELDLSDSKISASVDEWRDFLRFNEDGHVILTKEGLCNKKLVKYIFSDALEEEIYSRLVDAILNTKEKEKPKTKTIRFPK